MALYAIGDLHLSLGAADKPMDVFGGRWIGYTEKLRENLACIGPEDTTVLLGDLSWALGLEDAREDLAFIASIPGRKLLLKGNHDYWWATAAAFRKLCQREGFSGMELLHNACWFYEDIALCGTRGWFYEESRASAHDEKIFRRELGRLEASLKLAQGREIYCFLHYPPVYHGYECPEILELLSRYGVTHCFYGHLHGPSIKLAFEGVRDGIAYRLLSADAVDFAPQRLL